MIKKDVCLVVVNNGVNGQWIFYLWEHVGELSFCLVASITTALFVVVSELSKEKLRWHQYRTRSREGGWQARDCARI